MTAMEPESGPAPQAASTGSILRAVAIAICGAVAVLTTIVLPAEYGIDPLGTGAALGLTAIAPGAALEPVAPPEGATLAPVVNGPVALYPAAFAVDAREFELGPYEYVEYKYHLATGASMLFSWNATAAVMHEFHGDRDGGDPNNPESYDRQPRQRADGSFTAPFSGIHGWYWENPGGDTVTVRVSTAGFYTQAHEFLFDRTRSIRPIQDVSAIRLTSN
jgi:hypothetical protein